MSVFKVTKTPSEEFDILVTLENENPDITYQIDAINSITAINRKTREDDADTIIDIDKCEYSGSQFFVWVQGGEDGDIYDIEANVSTTTLQEFSKCIELTIRAKK